MPFCSQWDVLDYLARYDVNLPEEITVEWCPLKTDVGVPPMAGYLSIHRSWRRDEASFDRHRPQCLGILQGYSVITDGRGLVSASMF